MNIYVNNWTIYVDKVQSCINHCNPPPFNCWWVTVVFQFHYLCNKGILYIFCLYTKQVLTIPALIICFTLTNRIYVLKVTLLT